jgi:methanogenic corrinoid protein MtbC1
MSIAPARVEEFTEQVACRDLGGATRLALRLADEGAPVADLLGGLVSAAQIEVGERWHRNQINVADEHAATAVSDAVVTVLTATASPPVTGPEVVVVCAENEWHLLAARLTAEVLRADGCAVTFLGGSVPAVHLAGFLQGARPDVLAVSCSTPLALLGVLSCAQVAHDLGIPVIAGGRALGSDERRARVLGADLWAPDAATGAELLRDPLPAANRIPTADVGGAMEIALHREAMVDKAMADLAVRFPGFGRFDDAQRDRTREDFAYILRFAEAAVLTGDGRLFAEFVDWLDRLLAARGLPPSVLNLSLEILTDTAVSLPAVTSLLTSAQVPG